MLTTSTSCEKLIVYEAVKIKNIAAR